MQAGYARDTFPFAASLIVAALATGCLLDASPYANDDTTASTTGATTGPSTGTSTTTGAGATGGAGGSATTSGGATTTGTEPLSKECEDCAMAGGACDAAQMRCSFECSDTMSCARTLVCPKGLACQVDCPGQGSCAGGVDCSASSSCDVACSGPGACTNVDGIVPFTCGSGQCAFHCTGFESCGVTELDCTKGKCDISCEQAVSTCAVLSCAGDCTIGCVGEQSCYQVTCSGGPCTIDCAGENGCDFVDCADACSCALTCPGIAACSISEPACPSPGGNDCAVSNGCTASDDCGICP